LTGGETVLCWAKAAAGTRAVAAKVMIANFFIMRPLFREASPAAPGGKGRLRLF
jgi:hypothetical protein